MDYDRIALNELEQISIKDEINALEREIENYEQQEMLNVNELAQNLNKTKGNKLHELGNLTKREAERDRRLRANPEYLKLIDKLTELNKDYEFVAIETRFLIREHEREINFCKSLIKTGDEK